VKRRKRIPNQECHICGKVLRDKYNLKRHISSHLGEKNHICELCEPVKFFADASNLRGHIKTKHPEQIFGFDPLEGGSN